MTFSSIVPWRWRGWLVLVFLSVAGAATPILAVMATLDPFCCTRLEDAMVDSQEVALEQARGWAFISGLVLLTGGAVMVWLARRHPEGFGSGRLVLSPGPLGWLLRAGIGVILAFVAGAMIRLTSESSGVFLFHPSVGVGSLAVLAAAVLAALMVALASVLVWHGRIPTWRGTTVFLLAVFGAAQWGSVGLAILAL